MRTSGVIGGIVYSLDGDFPGGNSRISETIDIVNKTGAPVSLSLTGLGFKPTQPKLEVPDLTGLDITGTTVVFVVNHGSITEESPPTAEWKFSFGQVTVFQFVRFSGFNPILGSPYTLPPGATLTMITELIVGNPSFCLSNCIAGSPFRPVPPFARSAGLAFPKSQDSTSLALPTRIFRTANPIHGTP